MRGRNSRMSLIAKIQILPGFFDDWKADASNCAIYSESAYRETRGCSRKKDDLHPTNRYVGRVDLRRPVSKDINEA